MPPSTQLDIRLNPTYAALSNWHVLLRAQDPASVLRPFLPLPPGWRVDIDPVTLL